MESYGREVKKPSFQFSLSRPAFYGHFPPLNNGDTSLAGSSAFRVLAERIEFEYLPEFECLLAAFKSYPQLWFIFTQESEP